MVAATTMAVRRNRSSVMPEPSRWISVVGRTDGAGCWVTPKASSMDDCRTSSTPSEATILASGEVLRNGR